MFAIYTSGRINVPVRCLLQEAIDYPSAINVKVVAQRGSSRLENLDSDPLELFLADLAMQIRRFYVSTSRYCIRQSERLLGSLITFILSYPRISAVLTKVISKWPALHGTLIAIGLRGGAPTSLSEPQLELDQQSKRIKTIYQMLLEAAPDASENSL